MNVSKSWRNLIISQSEMAKILKVTQQRISQMRKNDEVVCDENGKILLVQSLEQIYNKNSQNSCESVSFEEERALHEKAKREIAELKLGELKNDLHKTADMVIVFRRTLLALPSKMATSLAGKTPEDINEILTKEINRALKELSEFDAAKLAEIDAKNDEEE